MRVQNYGYNTDPPEFDEHLNHKYIMLETLRDQISRCKCDLIEDTDEEDIPMMEAKLEELEHELESLERYIESYEDGYTEEYEGGYLDE